MAAGVAATACTDAPVAGVHSACATASRLRRQLRSRQAHSPAVAGLPNEGEPAQTVPDVRLYPAASATQDDCNSDIAHDNSTMKSLASAHLQASTVKLGL
jgi:hypothetical protein